jgi:anti-anti-sigma factor
MVRFELSGHMHLASRLEPDATIVLTVSGDVDFAVADDLRAVALGMVASTECRRLCLDLAGVSFLDSTGISALVAIRNAAEASTRTLLLRNPSKPVARLLDLTGLTPVFTVESTGTDA